MLEEAGIFGALMESEPDRGAEGQEPCATDRRRGAKGSDGQAARARVAASGGGRAGGDPGDELGAKELREGLVELAGQVSWYEHKPYGAVLHVALRVLTWLSATGDVVRGRNAGDWRISRPLWTRMDDWLGAPVSRCEVREGYAELVGRYLRTFGPVTERDLVWWFGATKGAMRQALSDLNAVQVLLERAQTGWVLPDDVDPEPQVEPWAALLPALDPRRWAGRTVTSTSIRTSRRPCSTGPATSAPPPGGTVRSLAPTCRTTPGRSS